ncbi:BAL_1a_G0043160.mRNA.1.CDS.1 [Saccharomyces cerevisiae]|nr:BAL_1a_G0043160.mRNA.1.CDS.1 [Saccharomyces cerevisiae]CAI7288173.1 BAL_1a_G0043160.mRNA.1.CDS.1 [Saccharomyces cerevisiae]
MTVVIGVLALQGAFIEHVRHVEKCIVENRDFYEKKLSVMTVKDKNQLAQCDALIIPGGESTAMSLIAERTGFYDDLYAFVHNPRKVTWGTCAGLIYISQQLSNEAKLVKTLNLLKVKVKEMHLGDKLSLLPGFATFQTLFLTAMIFLLLL